MKKTFVTLPRISNINMFTETIYRLIENIEDIIGNQTISKVTFDEQINRITVQSNANTEECHIPQIIKKTESGTTSIIITNVFPMKAIDFCNLLAHINLCITIMYQDKVTIENKREEIIKIIDFKLSKEQMVLVFDHEIDLSDVDLTPHFTDEANFGVKKDLFDFEEDDLFKYFSKEKNQTAKQLEKAEDKTSDELNEESTSLLNNIEPSKNYEDSAIATLDNQIIESASVSEEAVSSKIQDVEIVVEDGMQQTLGITIVETGSTKETEVSKIVVNDELQTQEICDSKSTETELDSKKNIEFEIQDNRSSESLMIVDGNNLLMRGYFATADGVEEAKLKRNSRGQFINGIELFIQQLNRYFKKYTTDSVIVCFDCNNPFLDNFRKQIYSEYKETRDEKPVSLLQQLDMIFDVVKSLNIPYLVDSTGYYEADDLIGSVIKKWRKQSCGPIYIVSNDKDLYQLLEVNTYQILKKVGGIDVLYSLEDYTKEFGITTSQWIDVKTIKGDSSDNVKGISGIGETYVYDMIRDFGGLNSIYERLDELRTHPKYKRYASKFEQQREEALLSQKLVTIICDDKIECIEKLDLSTLSTNNILNLEKDKIYQTLGWY